MTPVNNPRILMADDSAIMRATIPRILRNNGCEVVTVASNPEVLSKVKSASFDIVLLDVDRHDSGRMRTFKAIRKVNPKIAIIIMSRDPTFEIMEKALKLGARGCLLKPFGVSVLVDTVEKIVMEKQG